MDLRQFVPRYTSETAVQFSSGDSSKTLPPRARHLPLRSAPPIIPARNPLRVGKAPRPLETVAKIWDPEVGDYVTRQSSGGFAHIAETSAQLGNRNIQRSISTNTFQHRALLVSASDQRSSFGHLLHKEIEQLRQSFIELQNDDDIFAPTTPPRRSASSATLRTPVRNFSLPTYSPPNQQFAPTRPLRRVRSRSVNLGPVAEANELPDYPVRRESLQVTAVAARQVKTNPDLETALQQIGETSEAVETLIESKNIKQTVVVELKREGVVEAHREGTCNSCCSTRKALAMNPMCCIDRPEKGRLCFHCWRDLLAEGVSKQDRKNWLCSLHCRNELAMTDAKRLASRGTILK
jgi:hypothetical protein